MSSCLRCSSQLPVRPPKTRGRLRKYCVECRPGSKACKLCGETFIFERSRGGARQYCSPLCSKTGRRVRESKYSRRTCRDCGETCGHAGRCRGCYVLAKFPLSACVVCGDTVPRGGRKTCGDTCLETRRRQMAVARLPPERTCIGCGAVFSRRSKPSDKRLYCKRECAFAHRSGRANKAQDRCQCGGMKLINRHTCAKCQQAAARAAAIAAVHCCSFCGRSCSAKRKHCGEECRTKSALRAMRERYQASLPPPVARTCPCCGNSFVPKVRSDRVAWCSPRCWKLMRKHRRNFGSLSGIPVSEREELAKTLATYKQFCVEVYRRNRGTDPTKETPDVRDQSYQAIDTQRIADRAV
jgi:predicted nucleic acid-binding Zn ribbon protein